MLDKTKCFEIKKISLRLTLGACTASPIDFITGASIRASAVASIDARVNTDGWKKKAERNTEF